MQSAVEVSALHLNFSARLVAYFMQLRMIIAEDASVIFHPGLSTVLALGAL